MKEKCKNCVFCAGLYVPPIPYYEEIPKNKHVCTLFLKEGDVMYLPDDEGMCEMFTPKDL